MSDAVRNYSGSGGVRRKTRRQRLGALRNLLLLFLLPLAAYLWWTTRDAWDMAQLIPGRQTYQLYANDFLNNRGTIAQSRVWQLLPEETALAQARVSMLDNFGLPEWVLNNVVHGLSHVSGNDLDDFSDVLFITKMTRVGVLLERLHRFIPEIRREHAGGLKLRQVEDAGVWYAVRGRVLLITPDRDTLIRSLTLKGDDTVGSAALAAGRDALRAGEDIFGRIDLREGDPWSDTLEALEIKVWVEEDALRVACQGALSPSWREWLLPVLVDASPQPLHAPPSGIVELSANFGKPLPRLWDGLQAVLDLDAPLPPPGDWLRGIQPDDGPDTAGLLGELMLHTGNGWRLSWTGVDELAFAPMPAFAASIDVDPAAAEERLTLAAEFGEGLGLATDAETGLLHMPLIGGPALEPAVALRGTQLLLGTSREAARSLVQQPPPRATLTEAGTLFARIRPAPLIEAAASAGHELAVIGALRGHTADSWASTTDIWAETAQRIRDITALVAHENGIIRFEMNLFMAAAQEAEAPGPEAVAQEPQ